VTRELHTAKYALLPSAVGVTLSSLSAVS